LRPMRAAPSSDSCWVTVAMASCCWTASTIATYTSQQRIRNTNLVPGLLLMSMVSYHNILLPRTCYDAAASLL
jgi:hypothetical protein